MAAVWNDRNGATSVLSRASHRRQFSADSGHSQHRDQIAEAHPCRSFAATGAIGVRDSTLPVERAALEIGRFGTGVRSFCVLR